MLTYQLYIKDRRVYFKCVTNSVLPVDRANGVDNNLARLVAKETNFYIFNVQDSSNYYYYRGNYFINLKADFILRTTRFRVKAGAVIHANNLFAALQLYTNLQAGNSLPSEILFLHENSF